MRLSAWASGFGQLAGGRSFDRWFDVFSIYLVPAILAISTALFFTISPSGDVSIETTPLDFHAFIDGSDRPRRPRPCARCARRP